MILQNFNTLRGSAMAIVYKLINRPRLSSANLFFKKNMLDK